MNLKKAEDARESREKTLMKGTCAERQVHPAGECLLISIFLILFVLIRGQLPNLG
jgi:hypothetical protein